MSILSGQGNLNKLTQQVNFQWPEHYDETEVVSLAQSERYSYNWGNDFPVTSPNSYDILQMDNKLFDDNKPLNPKLEFGVKLGSMAQTEDMNPNWGSSATAMSSLGEAEGNPDANELPQLFNSHGNSQRNVEEGVRCFGPNPSHLDHAGQASNGRIPKACNPSLTPAGKGKSQLDQAGASTEACIGKKRKAREPKILTKEQEDEKKKKKNENDKKYRAGIKMELNELRRMKPLMEIVRRFGRIDSMLDKFKELEAMSRRMELMMSKYGGIQEIEFMLDKFKDMEAESHKLNKIKSKLGIQETESILDKFKKMEAELRRFNQVNLSFGGIDEIESGQKLQFGKHKQMVNQKEPESFQASPGSQQVSHQSGISLNSSAAVSETTPDMQYSDVLVDQLIARLADDNAVSNLDLNSFKDLLDGEWESVGKYKIPPSLASTAHDIFKVHGDITKKSKYSGHAVQVIFVLFCAAIKEMGDLSLEEVTEKIIWKLRDAIMDAKRCKFDVEFAMKHLKTIVQGYFGLKARKDRDTLEQRIASLRADEEALRKELGNKSNEIKAVEAKQRDLTSEKCKICLESADKFLGKMVGIF